MTAFDKKINQIATRHRWNIEKQARAAVPCYIIAAPTYEDTGKIVAVLNRCKGLHHETLTPIHYESWAVKVYDAGQIAAYRERERQKAALVDAFYMALKANGWPSFAIRSRTACKIYPCMLCPDAFAAAFIAFASGVNGFRFICVHFALYLSLFSLFLADTAIILPLFIFIYKI